MSVGDGCRWFFYHHNFHTLNDIPKSVMFPPETQYSLACVILSDGGHFRGISLDSRNSHGIHLIFDGINEPEKRIQIISLDDPFSKIAPLYAIMELWYVKVDGGRSSSAGSGTASLTIPPWHHQCIHHSHPCLLMIYQQCLHMYYQQF